MNNLWTARVDKILEKYQVADLLSQREIVTVKRAPYFDQYRIAIHFSPTTENWPHYEELLARLAQQLEGINTKLVTSKPALFYNVYGDDPKVLRKIYTLRKLFQFNSIHMIDQTWWDKKLPEPKPKGLYHGRYGFRVRFVDVPCMQKIPFATIFTGSWLASVVKGRAFLYLTDVRDVIMLKVAQQHDILEISER